MNKKKVAVILFNDMHMDIEKANYLLNELVRNDDYEVICDYTLADIVIVLTCAFGAGKNYSMHCLADVKINAKKDAKIIVTGCLAKLYSEKLSLVLGFDVVPFEELMKNLDNDIKFFIPQNKVIISEGCNKKCSYCVYPLFANKYKSKPLEDILNEIDTMSNVENTIYITGALETSDWGVDIYGKRSFSKLLDEICTRYEDTNFVIGWFNPDGLTNEVMCAIQKYENIVGIMLHLQHVDDEILKNMHRTPFKVVDSKITKLLELRPSLEISTEVIVGFPGETKESFEKLVNYLGKNYFKDIAVATYEKVPNTKAYYLENQVSDSEKVQRLMEVCRKFNATPYFSPKDNESDIVLEYIKAKNLLVNIPKNIYKSEARQKYYLIAGIDTKEKINYLEEVNMLYHEMIEARSVLDIGRLKEKIENTYTKEFLMFFYQIIQNTSLIKEGMRQKITEFLFS